MNWSAAKATRVLAALARIGWIEKRRTGSHRVLQRDGWANFVFAFHEQEEWGYPGFVDRLILGQATTA